MSVIDARSVEQPVDLEDGDDVFNWPWLYAVEVGTWDLTDDAGRDSYASICCAAAS